MSHRLYKETELKRFLSLVVTALLLSGCANPPVEPSAKDSIDKACAAWKLADSKRDYDTALKNFAEAASIDPGYIEVSKSAQILEMVFNRLIDSDITTDELTNHLLNVNAVCDLSQK